MNWTGFPCLWWFGREKGDHVDALQEIHKTASFFFPLAFHIFGSYAKPLRMAVEAWILVPGLFDTQLEGNKWLYRSRA